MKLRPAAQHIVVIGLDHDARRPDRAHGDLLLEILQKFLLPQHDLVFSRAGRGIGEECRAVHSLKCGNDRWILGLWLVDQDVDANGLWLEPIDPLERLGQYGPVERRSLAGRRKRLVGIDDHHDPVILVHLGRRENLPPIEERAFCLDRQRQFPGVAGKEHGSRQEQDGQEKAPQTELAQACSRSLGERCAPAPGLEVRHRVPVRSRFSTPCQHGLGAIPDHGKTGPVIRVRGCGIVHKGMLGFGKCACG